ncbi:MAG: site-specific DNA-methyltransferase [Thermoleophilia bacterium]|nr:site-specific DNA-methyltransferase [Thermoleophilia bacterium]
MSECTCQHCGHRFEAEPQEKHRVMCGDATSDTEVATLISGEAPELLATDPPYNVGLGYDEATDDSRSDQAYREFTRQWFAAACRFSQRQLVTPGCHNLAMWLQLFAPYHVAPWIKTNAMTNGKVSRFWCWEPIVFFGEHWPRTRPHDVFDFPAGTHKDTGGHPCPKPVRMWAELQSYASDGASVLDPFLGSGTTLVAAEQVGRRCLGMDISPAYVDVALRRWMSLTEQQPTLAATGQTFAEVRHERNG